MDSISPELGRQAIKTDYPVNFAVLDPVLWLWRIPACTVCGSKGHSHGCGGGAVDPGRTLGHRAAPAFCSAAQGYLIVDGCPDRTERLWRAFLSVERELGIVANGEFKTRLVARLVCKQFPELVRAYKEAMAELR